MPRDRRDEMIISDPGNHRTLEALLPSAFVHQIKLLAQGENSHLLAMGERDLKRAIRGAGYDIEKRDYILRQQFWAEYDGAQHAVGNAAGPINMSKVIRRSIPKEIFYKHYITNPYKLAWLLSFPQDYRDALEQLAFHAIDKLHDALDIMKVERNGFIEGQTVKRIEGILTASISKLAIFQGGKAARGVLSHEKLKMSRHNKEEISEETTPLAETPDEKLARLKAEREAIEAEKKSTGIGRENPPVIE